MTTSRKYIRTEPPAPLTKSLTLTLSGHALSALNAYREARHAWLACTGELGERTLLHRKMQGAAADLAGFIGGAAQYQLGEPSDYADEEESESECALESDLKYHLKSQEGDYSALFKADDTAPARAISISEPLCKAYANLFADDFSEDEIRKSTAENHLVVGANFESILRRFLDGLANSRLELEGTTDDLAGWIATYLEAYVEPGDGEVDVPFNNWDSLTSLEKQEVKADSIRLTPILRRPWPGIWPEHSE